MTEEQLVDKLAKLYRELKGRREAALALHLFGIAYVEELQGKDRGRIAVKATGYSSYGNEIWKGMKLARYVQLKPSARIHELLGSREGVC